MKRLTPRILKSSRLASIPSNRTLSGGASTKPRDVDGRSGASFQKIQATLAILSPILIFALGYQLVESKKLATEHERLALERSKILLDELNQQLQSQRVVQDTIRTELERERKSLDEQRTRNDSERVTLEKLRSSNDQQRLLLEARQSQRADKAQTNDDHRLRNQQTSLSIDLGRLMNDLRPLASVECNPVRFPLTNRVSYRCRTSNNGAQAFSYPSPTIRVLDSDSRPVPDGTYKITKVSGNTVLAKSHASNEYEVELSSAEVDAKPAFVEISFRFATDWRIVNAIQRIATAHITSEDAAALSSQGYVYLMELPRSAF